MDADIIELLCNNQLSHYQLKLFDVKYENLKIISLIYATCNDKRLIYPLNCKTCGKQSVGVLLPILEVDRTTITIGLMLEKMRVVT